MSIASSIQAAVTFGNQTNIQTPANWLINAWGGGRQTVSGIRVTPEISNTYATYFACVRVIMEDVAKLPIGVFRDVDDGTREKIRDHPVHAVLKNPNPDMRGQAYREAITNWAINYGGGLSEIVLDQSTGEVAELWPIHPSRTRIFKDKKLDNQLFYEVINDDMSRVRLLPEQVLHIMGLSRDGIVGYGAAELARETTGYGLALNAYGQAFFGNNASLGSLIEIPGKMEDEQLKNFRRTWREMHQGAKKAGTFAILENGMTYKEMASPPKAAQFLESKEFAVEDMARFFRMNPNKIGHLKRIIYSNASEANRVHADDTISPWVLRWEVEINAKLFLSKDKDLFVKHNMNALKRGDMQARGDFYRILAGLGAPPNRLLALEDMDAIGPEGDASWIDTNLQPMKRALEPPEPPPPVPPPIIDDLPVDDDDEEDERAQRVEASHRRAIEANVRLAVRKEIKAVQAAEKRYAEDRDKFQPWLEKFFSEHRHYMMDLIFPPAMACYDAISPDYLPAKAMGVRAYLKNSVNEYIVYTMHFLSTDWLDRATHSTSQYDYSESSSIDLMTEKVMSFCMKGEDNGNSTDGEIQD